MKTRAWVWLFLFVTVNVVQVLGQVPSDDRDAEEEKSYRLSGRLISYETEQTPTRYYVKLKIEFNLKNVGRRNLILWERKNPEFCEEPTFTGKVLSRDESFTDSSVIEQHYGGPSNDYSIKWNLLREKLDKPSPPDDVTMTIAPNDSWHFMREVTIIADKEDNDRTRELSFLAYVNISPIYIKTSFEVWSPNIDRKDDEVDLKIGTRLKASWSKHGNLLLRDIISDPIPIDFRDFQIKE